MLKAYLYLKLIDVKSALMLKGTDIQKVQRQLVFDINIEAHFGYLIELLMINDN